MEAIAAERVDGRVSVAFIAGTSWSGSTALEQALAQLDGCVSMGEPFWLWDPDWPMMVCECGREFRDCDFWQAVLIEAYGARRDAVRSQVRARSKGLWRHSILPTLAKSEHHFRPTAAMFELASMVEPLYRAFASITGAATVVDASKAGLWGLVTVLADGLDVRVAHLVRAPMGFVSSDVRPREVPYPPGATRPPRDPARSLLTWLLLNLEADLLKQRVETSTVVLYDDLFRSPSLTTSRVALAMGADGDLTGVFVDNTLLVRRTAHAIGGNPRRPRLGETVIAHSPGKPPYFETAAVVRRTLVPLVRHRYDRYVQESRMLANYVA